MFSEPHPSLRARQGFTFFGISVLMSVSELALPPHLPQDALIFLYLGLRRPVCIHQVDQAGENLQWSSCLLRAGIAARSSCALPSAVFFSFLPHLSVHCPRVQLTGTQTPRCVIIVTMSKSLKQELKRKGAMFSVFNMSWNSQYESVMIRSPNGYSKNNAGHGGTCQ